MADENFVALSGKGRPLSGVARHWQVFTSAWALDAEASKTRKQFAQTEFLPASLEVIETPASPFGRFGLWFLAGSVGVAIAWSFIGKLDVVVAAPGKVIPVDRVKVVQPTELGVVRAIHVRDGQEVKAGQLLIELDPTTAGADDMQARTGLKAAQIEGTRSEALIGYLETGRLSFSSPAGSRNGLSSMQHDLAAAQLQEYEARRGVLQSQRAEHAADAAGARAEQAKLRETLPLLEQQLNGRRQLAEKGYFSRLKVLEVEEERIERIRNIDVQEAAVAKAEAAISGIDQQLAQLRSELSRTTIKNLADARDNANLRRSEIEKTDMRSRLMRLTSPVDGTVQQLAVHTLGGVVEPAQALMVIVPNGVRLVVEALVLNKDVGFVRVGQPVRIKVDAFPFTDYGTVSGELIGLSSDAVQDEKLGLVYNARVQLAEGSAGAARERMKLSPGMSVSAEIKTARRRVIQYLLSPIVARMDEAGRER